jgi:assimilatory nitrate reductase catalytic subunit
MHTTPRFMQGSYHFEGQGLCKPVLIDPALTYTVAPGTTAQALYFRGGNSTDEMIAVLLMRDGKPMRYFPIGARDGTHVPLRVVEDLISCTQIELHIAAPEGCVEIVVVDFGLLEV